jgi:hypothetical protein
MPKKLYLTEKNTVSLKYGKPGRKKGAAFRDLPETKGVNGDLRRPYKILYH